MNLSFDGKGINGNDTFRSRIATFTSTEAAYNYGDLFAASQDVLYAMQDMIAQADAQFKVGDRHATFNRQTIDSYRAAIARATGDTAR